MAERKRNKEIHFYVTEEERKLIRRKMIESKTKNMGAYLRKMAIDGYIVNTDTTPLKKQYEEMHKIGVNINQMLSIFLSAVPLVSAPLFHIPLPALEALIDRKS